MARYDKRLTALVVKQTKPNPDGKSVVLLDGYGLRLLVTPTGRKYWQFKTKRGGKESTAQLGIFPAMSLDEARKEANRMREMLREGHNPILENRVRKLRNSVRAETTFAGYAELLLTNKKTGVGRSEPVSDAYFKKMDGAIRANLLPTLGPLPIQSVDSIVLRAALKKIEDRGSLEMLDNVRRWAGEIFDLAKADMAYVGDNPAQVLMRNIFKKNKSQNMRALAWSELPGFMQRLDQIDAQPETLAAIRLLILSACRPGEVRGAKWDEIDESRARWTIPAERMKMRIPHAVPLSRQMLAVLAVLRPLTGNRKYLFPARSGSKSPVLSEMALLGAVRRAAERDIHAHGFRAMFSTYVSESLLWDDKVKEAALAHSKGGIQGVYDKATHYAERTKLAQWYADEIDKASTLK